MKAKKTEHCKGCGAPLEEERHWIDGDVVCRRCAMRVDPQWVYLCDQLTHDPRKGVHA
jgi:hypothetical protein